METVFQKNQNVYKRISGFFWCPHSFGSALDVSSQAEAYLEFPLEVYATFLSFLDINGLKREITTFRWENSIYHAICRSFSGMLPEESKARNALDTESVNVRCDIASEMGRRHRQRSLWLALGIEKAWSQ